MSERRVHAMIAPPQLRFLVSERGASLIAVVLFLPVLLLIAGLVTDVGLLFVARHLAYHAAELGALAGAQDVDLDALARGEVTLVEGQARADAEDYARRNLAASFRHLDQAQALFVNATVYNASAARPVRHRETGRLLTDPTVSVAVRLWLPLHFLAPLRREAAVQVHADASVTTRQAR